VVLTPSARDFIPSSMPPPPSVGVCYARTDAGVELPVVDITHPAFALSVTASEQQRRLEQFAAEQQTYERLPRWLYELLLRWLLRRSVLARSLRAARGSVLPGLDTYLFKLGPDNLPAHCAAIDQRIAAALPALGMRLRLQHTARLLAEAVLPALSAGGERPATSARRPLHLLNIAGGPAMDSLNALIVLRREHPEALEARPIRIVVLDPDRAGPSFGQRALAALQGAGAPLAGLSVELGWHDYDWSRPETLDVALAAARAAHAVVALSSEGGLFEYGSDQQIVANLAAFRRGSGEGVAVVGSVTRGDPATRQVVRSGRAALVPRGLDVFRPLVERAGFRLERALEGPFSDQVLLRALAAESPGLG
jgi:hypothetical protein